MYHRRCLQTYCRAHCLYGVAGSGDNFEPLLRGMCKIIDGGPVGINQHVLFARCVVVAAAATACIEAGVVLAANEIE